MKMPISVIVGGFLLVTYAASADNASVIGQLKEASKISNDSIRLRAYDQILEDSGIRQRLLNENSAPATGNDSKWMVTMDINPIDDSRVIVFGLIADKGTSDFGKPIGLLIRYESKKTEIYVTWNDYLGDEVYVTMRIGDEKAETFRWNISTNKTATFYPRNCISLINRIINADKIVFQCTPYNESPVTAIFDVRGLKEAADEYMSDLKWW